MNDRQNISVAVPWSLSHYIPQDGFHPLYQALFDYAPDTINILAWDNVALCRRFRGNVSIPNTLVAMAQERARRAGNLTRNSI